MLNNSNEIKNLLSNPSSIVDAFHMDSVNDTEERENFWVGLKLPKLLIFGGLGYYAGGTIAVYGGKIGVFLVGLLAVIFYLFDLMRGSG